MTRPMPPTDPRGLSPEVFFRSLAQVAWFKHLGEPSPQDHQVVRIRDWQEWPGPESPEVQDLGPLSQSWYGELIKGAEPRRTEFEAFWERIKVVVLEHARDEVPYDPEEDSWHGPTAAVWHAAWVAGVVGCSLLLGSEIPSEVINEWSWFVEGHWPCAYAYGPKEGEPVVLMVL